MPALSGLNGTVTYAAGYTILAQGWQMMVAAAPQDLTPINPAGDHQQLMTSGLLLGAAGSYVCRLGVPATALGGGGVGAYDAYPEEWQFVNTCEAREVTVLGATWRTYLSGLKTTGIQIVSYIEDTQVLPLAGTNRTATLQTDTGRFYTVPYVVLGHDSGVDAEDTERMVRQILSEAQLKRLQDELELDLAAGLLVNHTRDTRTKIPMPGPLVRVKATGYLNIATPAVVDEPS